MDPGRGAADGKRVSGIRATTQEQINQAQQRSSRRSPSLESTQDRIEEIESQKGQTEAYLSELSGS